ncbi:MAG: hypothetical protein H6684_07910 [Deltaproteobacteria bacterium]|nr:hypothetical protein [Deltaproteobacteria bacterium]MCB9488639.1 hypothetical protein [Deltaproteobacteria bacterium]
MRGARWALLIISAAVGGILLAWPYESRDSELIEHLNRNAMKDTNREVLDGVSDSKTEYAVREARAAEMAQANRTALAVGERTLRVQFQRRAAVRDKRFNDRMRATSIASASTGSGEPEMKDLATIKQEYDTQLLAQRRIEQERNRDLGEGVLRGGPETKSGPAPQPRPLTQVEALRLQRESAPPAPAPMKRTEEVVNFASYLEELTEVDPELTADPEVTFVFGGATSNAFTFTVRHAKGDEEYVFNQGGRLK